MRAPSDRVEAPSVPRRGPASAHLAPGALLVSVPAATSHDNGKALCVAGTRLSTLDGNSRPEGFVYPDSRRNSAILVYQSTESGDANDHTVLTPDGVGLRCLERETTVRSFFVVVPEICFENPLQMSLAEDQEVVQACVSHRLHEALGKGVRLRGADGRVHDTHALCERLRRTGH